MIMVFYTRNEDRTGCSSCQVKSCVSAMYKSKRPVKIRSSKVYISAKLDLLPSSITQCFICGLNHRRIEGAQTSEHAIITYESKTMANNVRSYKILHKDYLRDSPPQSRVSLKPAGFAQDITRYKHVQLLDAKFSAHTIGFITKIGEQDTSFRLFLGPNYINIEMSLRLFRHLVYKTKPRKRFLKNVSDIMDYTALFSLNNADMETAEIAIQEELGRLKQNLQMEELEPMNKGLKVRSLYKMKYMMPQLTLVILFMVSKLLLWLYTGSSTIYITHQLGPFIELRTVEQHVPLSSRQILDQEVTWEYSFSFLF
ncbi:hypothetical protein J3E69DRAFT_271346 [Trichoderma sp. SZMC 28015]